MAGFLGKLFGGGHKTYPTSPQDVMAGQVLCEHCGTRMRIDSLPALTMVNCPSCNGLVFAPGLLEGFWVVRPLAAGGFGAVYWGFSPETGQEVAVKLVRFDENTTREAVDAFLREGEIAYGLPEHPHLAQTLGYGETEELAFIVMAHVAGTRVSDHVLERQEGLPAELALYYILDTVNGLDAVYRAGYLYRDIKPENLILTPQGFITLIDFGLCLPIEMGPESGKLPVVGSPLCMAPERYLKQGEDVRSEIYSLGMVLYFMLTGAFYFTQQEVQRVAKGHTSNARLPTKSKMFGFDDTIIGFVDRMIARKPADRFADYDEVLAALGEVLGTYQAKPSKNPGIMARRQHFVATYGGG